jgi:metal-responsive CopG/Arc/MetJ family transcriptional regulator
MKVKTSITLSEDLLKTIDGLAGEHKKNRSDFIENALRAFVREILRARQNQRDMEIINQQAGKLNREAADVLEYQAPL